MSSVKKWISGWFETQTEPKQTQPAPSPPQTPSPPPSPIVRSTRPIAQKSHFRHASAVPASKTGNVVLTTPTRQAPTILVPAKRAASETLESPNKRISQPGGTNGRHLQHDAVEPSVARTHHSPDSTPGESDDVDVPQTITLYIAGEDATLPAPFDHSLFRSEGHNHELDPQLDGPLPTAAHAESFHHTHLQGSSHALRKKVTAYLNTKGGDQPAPSSETGNVSRKRKFPWDIDHTTSGKKRARVTEERKLLIAKRQPTPPRDGKQQLRLKGLWSRDSWKCSGPRGLDLLVRK